MVQSIFDDGDEDVQPRRAEPAPPQRYATYDDDPFGFGDIAPAAPTSKPPEPAQAAEPADPDPIFELADDPLLLPPPPSRVQPAPTQLDGQQRLDAGHQQQSVYEEDWYGTGLGSADVRRSGLAWSAGVAFFASVVFMLFVGWGADLLFGSSPWCLVLGIVLGSVIGFIQFFRISSQIYSPKKDLPDISPLMAPSKTDENRDEWH